ncbi:ribosomal-processing cysteine protease Prp [Desmospora profundinema]|uniref:Ribosomal processing cysteine protease Prp n=1 Tax=Desmospora profundinema TaxID=1571184 RepID=A0ABU1IRN6_9BACL|nr:ribosomal-processing cysteine protease Prp [Desmospora profundinema]MDR6226405.1 uncharacterized protein YsxB (DUF464 family) [Desmospora profundinema]
MIRIMVERDGEGRLDRVLIKGHAQAGPYGRDLVCAAVSGIAIGMVNAIESILQSRVYWVADENEGHLDCRVPSGLEPDREDKVRLLLEAMAESLRQVALEHPSHVTFEDNKLY